MYFHRWMKVRSSNAATTVKIKTKFRINVDVVFSTEITKTAHWMISDKMNHIWNEPNIQHFPELHYQFWSKLLFVRGFMRFLHKMIDMWMNWQIRIYKRGKQNKRLKKTTQKRRIITTTIILNTEPSAFLL